MRIYHAPNTEFEFIINTVTLLSDPINYSKATDETIKIKRDGFDYFI